MHSINFSILLYYVLLLELFISLNMSLVIHLRELVMGSISQLRVQQHFSDGIQLVSTYNSSESVIFNSGGGTLQAALQGVS